MTIKTFTVDSTKNFPHSASLKISGDIGGNSQKNTIKITGDQFGDSTLLEFYGTWEMSSFFDLIESLKVKYYE